MSTAHEPVLSEEDERLILEIEEYLDNEGLAEVGYVEQALSDIQLVRPVPRQHLEDY